LAIYPSKRAIAGVLVALDQIAHVLGIERGGKRGRADEVAEQDGDLTTFGFRSRPGIGGCRWFLLRRLDRLDGRAVQRGDRFQESSPLTERNTELLEIRLGQIGKNVEVNVIVGPYAGQCVQAELFQPILKVGHVIWRRDRRAP
jgi:hypothetical protein